jgi:DNA-binding MarR family transcriptional regulator
MRTGASPGESRTATASPDLGLVDGLVQLSFAVQSLLGRATAAHGLSIIQTRLLGVLRDRELGMLELSRILELEKSSVTGLVDRAEARGLVQRNALPNDRRAVRVTLTAQGQRLARSVSEEVSAKITELTAELNPAQRTRLSQAASSLVFGYAAARSIPL